MEGVPQRYGVTSSSRISVERERMASGEAAIFYTTTGVASGALHRTRDGPTAIRLFRQSSVQQTLSHLFRPFPLACF